MAEVSGPNPTYAVVGASKHGAPKEVIESTRLPKPSPKGRELLIKVFSAAVSAADLRRIRNEGHGKALVTSPPIVSGYEGAGMVEAVGPDAASFSENDEVYFVTEFSRQGALGEYILVDERTVALKPENLNWEQAASLPAAAITTWEAFTEELGIQPPSADDEDKKKKTILIINGAGGVGSLAIQAAKRVFKLKVIATASRDESVKWCKDKGADLVINHREPLGPQLQRANIEALDYVLNNDEVSYYYGQLVPLMKPFGKICNVGSTSGVAIDLEPLRERRVSLHWEDFFMRMRYNIQPEKHGAILQVVASLVEDGALKAINHKSFSFTPSGVKDALELQASKKSMGKNIVNVYVSSGTRGPCKLCRVCG